MKLRNEIFLILFVTGLSVILITGILYFFNARSSIMMKTINQLESLSESKKQRVEDVLKKKVEELHFIETHLHINPEMVDYLENPAKDKFLNDSYHLQLNNTLSRALSEVAGFEKIHILGRRGNVIATTSPSFATRSLANHYCFKQALAHKSSFFVAWEKDSLCNLWVAAPLTNQNKFSGVLIAETDISELKAITCDYTGLGKTGETTLAEKISDSTAVFLTPLRFNKKTGMTIQLNRNNKQATFYAFSGNKNIFNDVPDYRGMDVIASCRYISGSKWGLVTKIDRTEALQPVKEFWTMSLRIGIISMGVLALISFLFANTIVNPINKITLAAQNISAGNLSQKVEVPTNNELGHLAESFNNMTQSLIMAQQKLDVKMQEIDRSNNALEKFAYIVSHDLKAPLNSIGSLSEIIVGENKDKVDEEGKKMFGMLQSKVKQMHALIHGILEYSKIDHANATPEKLDANEIVLHILENLSPPPHIKVEVAHLPTLYFERILIIQVFQNLISNAIKYNNKREGVIIKVGCKENEAGYQFFVSDNGMGIEEKYFEKIFDMFQTLQAKGSDSTGIGLAIVKKIVENKGGRVWIESKVRNGATFFFFLPKT